MILCYPCMVCDMNVILSMLQHFSEVKGEAFHVTKCKD